MLPFFNRYFLQAIIQRTCWSVVGGKALPLLVHVGVDEGLEEEGDEVDQSPEDIQQAAQTPRLGLQNLQEKGDEVDKPPEYIQQAAHSAQTPRLGLQHLQEEGDEVDKPPEDIQQAAQAPLLVLQHLQEGDEVDKTPEDVQQAAQTPRD